MVALHHCQDVDEPVVGHLACSPCEIRAAASPRQRMRVVGLVDRMKLSGFLRPVRNPRDTRATVLVPARMAADMVRGIVWPLLLALDLMNGGQQLETWLARDDAFSVAVLTQALELYCE